MIADVLVLPADVVIAPVAGLPAEVRARLRCADDDHAIGRPRTRGPSRLVDAGAAALLEEFRAPSSVTDAVTRFARARGVDPAAIAADALALVERLQRAAILVQAGGSRAGHDPDRDHAAAPIAPTLAEGAAIGDFIVERCLQALEDVEVYQARGPAGPIALKLARSAGDRATAAAFDREADVLHHLAHGPARARVPALHGRGALDGRAYLATAWCAGTSATAALDRLRAAGDRARVLAACVAIADAYADLHAGGVVHGDVHPRNLLVDEDGAVTLVDFGLARYVPGRPGCVEPPRAGVGFYFEPEYAAAWCRRERLPPASPRGEQHAVAALLYRLLTGQPYLAFSLERAEAFRQIAEEPPRRFADHGVDGPAAVEAALAIALRKRPEARHAGLAALADALRAAGELDAARPPAPPRRSAAPPAIGAALVDAAIERLGDGGPLFARGLMAPTASVNFGAAGVAYFFHRLAALRGSPALLATADRWAQRAAASVHDADAFHDPTLELTPAVTGPIALYHAPTGVRVVEALIAQAMGDGGGVQAAVRALAAAGRLPCANLDATLGQASVAIGCALVIDGAGPDAAAVEPARALADTVVAELEAALTAHPLLAERSPVPWLGIAHGWAGVLYAILLHGRAVGRAPSAIVQQRLTELAALGEPIGPHDALGWRRFATGAPSRLWPGWCHGSAGYVHLWALAHGQLGGDGFATLAARAARHVWEASAATSESDLCCGLAGQAYALVRTYQLTGDDTWLERARAIAGRAVAGHGRARTRPDSLYKGGLGIALLAAELAEPDEACMPLFDSPAWRRPGDRGL